MKVNIDVLGEVIKATKSYLDEYETEIDNITNLVNNIAYCWEGGDYEKFTNFWNKNYLAQKSPESIFKNELNEYYNFLKDAKTMYENMQKLLKAQSKIL